MNRLPKPLTLELLQRLVSETEPLAEISAAPMSKLSRLRTNLKKIRWHDLELSSNWDKMLLKIQGNDLRVQDSSFNRVLIFER